GRRSAQTSASGTAAPGRNRQARERDRRMRNRDSRDRADDVVARLLRRSRRRAADHRQAPGADVESRPSDAPLGRTAGGGSHRWSLTPIRNLITNLLYSTSESFP